ncbi:nuclear transport factor 2 family protein [Acinetobacter sp. NIPH 2699]|uniref:nuclear transport factor 2 family protein n=1 Tax=Acinetobacter sp. NIPH 2699 TaxID=2923433 RepID=UPI001F4A33BB|nr:nuclear transport factor 2 family protein [Acinetobacter sp. NIPH 2699]MCH7336014.1 nuclear transport factor 2 family protein [Acinetobacter sp. NIPH 2699]
MSKQSKPCQADIATIQLQLQRYFDGLYTSDVSLLRQVFHPDAVYICVTDQPLLKLTMNEYFPIVEQRISPASRKQLRQDKIISINIISEKTAIVHVECAIEPKYFYDALTFVHDNGVWKIISKVFHYHILSN